MARGSSYPLTEVISTGDKLLGFLADGSTVNFSRDAIADYVSGQQPGFTPESYGAVGDGVTDDTAALIALAAAVSSAGKGRIRFAPGKTYLVGNASQITPRFQGVNGLTIEGWGATIKTTDSGCPTTSLGYNWGILNFDSSNCSKIAILGLTIDGNRDGQLHTDGQANGFGINHGLCFWTSGTVSATDVLIFGCRILNTGTLTNSTDRRGDGIYAMTGIARLFIRDNVFESMGRWAFALTAGTGSSQEIYFQRNQVNNDDRGSGQFPWGSVDIEDKTHSSSRLFITDNDFSGTSYISYGGSLSGTGAITCEDTFILRNRWRIPSGATASNVPWQIGNGDPAAGTYREFKNLFIEDNNVLWEGTPGGTTHIGHTSKLNGAYIRRNLFVSLAGTAESDRGVQIGFAGHITGRVAIIDNDFVGLGEALKNANDWYTDPSPGVLDMVIVDNRFDNCNRAYNLQFNDLASAAGSKIRFSGGYARNSRSGSAEYVDGGSSGNITTNYYDKADRDNIWSHLNLTYIGLNTAQAANVANITSAATSGSLPTPNGSITIADATTPTVAELLEYCVELEAKIEAMLSSIQAAKQMA